MSHVIRFFVNRFVALVCIERIEVMRKEREKRSRHWNVPNLLINWMIYVATSKCNFRQTAKSRNKMKHASIESIMHFRINVNSLRLIFFSFCLKSAVEERTSGWCDATWEVVVRMNIRASYTTCRLYIPCCSALDSSMRNDINTKNHQQIWLHLSVGRCFRFYHFPLAAHCPHHIDSADLMFLPHRIFPHTHAFWTNWNAKRQPSRIQKKAHPSTIVKHLSRYHFVESGTFNSTQLSARDQCILFFSLPSNVFSPHFRQSSIQPPVAPHIHPHTRIQRSLVSRVTVCCCESVSSSSFATLFSPSHLIDAFHYI